MNVEGEAVDQQKTLQIVLDLLLQVNEKIDLLIEELGLDDEDFEMDSGSDSDETNDRKRIKLDRTCSIHRIDQ